MKYFGMALLAGALIAASAPAAAREKPAEGEIMLPVAYEALRDGKPHQAIAQLAATEEVAPRDPSRLINLGTAYAQVGRTSDAAAMYQAAVDTPIRYDLELSDGRYMDSRWAARMALAGLKQEPRVSVTMTGTP